MENLSPFVPYGTFCSAENFNVRKKEQYTHLKAISSNISFKKMLNGRYSMNKKFLTMGCISSLSLAMYSGCSDSTSAVDFYNVTEEIASSDSQETGSLEDPTSSASNEISSATSSATKKSGAYHITAL